MARRIVLFVLTNMAVLVMISIVTQLLGLQPYLSARGIDYTSLMVFCAIWGIGGSFISLLLSKKMAKWAMRVQVIDPQRASGSERELVSMVHRLSQAAGLPAMPEVGIYNSPEVNAFATGPSRGNALVAVSSGLLDRMGRNEVEGVLGHEVAHVANGDMVTMALIQGVVNAFVMFFARIAAFVVAGLLSGGQGNNGDSRESRPNFFIQHILVIAFDIAFGLLGSMVVCWFSRQREFRADAGGAQFAGREKMIGALRSLQHTTELVAASDTPLAAFKIAGRPKGLMALLVTHPPLSERIERLTLQAQSGARFAPVT
jgi:heat shock protein HtpX